MITAVRRRPFLAFVLLAYLGSWIAWSPWWLSLSGIGVLAYQLPQTAVLGINQLGLFAGPLPAALVITGIVDGRAGLRELWRRCLRWRIHPGWYGLAVIGIPVAAGAGYLVTGSVAPDLDAASQAAPLMITYVSYLLGGPIQEEPGWRGVAQPLLQQRRSPLPVALIIGVIHCCWHAPLFLTREWDTARSGPSQLAAYLVLVIGLSVVLSWLGNGSGGSLLIVIIGHNGLNWALAAVAALTGRPVTDTWPAALGIAALAVVAVIITRGRLGLPVAETDRGGPAAAGIR
ncbi:CPBP family intramembrane glutamic endopeptidase [Microlunatus sp. GCM10028923]|uniref:CPBP family intramembrane glutamic endopeptidase n=1 Tax=Microlunatus sp. GCM10028923 TaxID=3273400 RepID=UPI00360BFAFB